jgi:hypothetical protein
VVRPIDVAVEGEVATRVHVRAAHEQTVPGDELEELGEVLVRIAEVLDHLARDHDGELLGSRLVRIVELGVVSHLHDVANRHVRDAPHGRDVVVVEAAPDAVDHDLDLRSTEDVHGHPCHLVLAARLVLGPDARTAARQVLHVGLAAVPILGQFLYGDVAAFLAVGDIACQTRFRLVLHRLEGGARTRADQAAPGVAGLPIAVAEPSAGRPGVSACLELHGKGVPTAIHAETLA